MGGPDQGEWRFILIGVSCMHLAYPDYPYPAYLARCAMHEINEWFGGRGFGIARTFVVYTEEW
jgi:hypothetical protein